MIQIALLFSVLLVSVSAFLDQPGIHSNTHMTMLPFFMFGLYIGEVKLYNKSNNADELTNAGG